MFEGFVLGRAAILLSEKYGVYLAIIPYHSQGLISVAECFKCQEFSAIGSEQKSRQQF